MIAQSCQDFLEQEIYPELDELDALTEGLMASKITKAGELGLCGISVPEELGGFGKNFVTSMLTAEVTGAGHSFAVALSAHTGIGTLPILIMVMSLKSRLTFQNSLVVNGKGVIVFNGAKFGIGCQLR